MKKTILSILSLFLITACATPMGNTTYNTPRFTNLPPIELNVKNISVVSEFTPTFRRPNVEHLFPVSLEKTAKSWVQDRLIAANNTSSNEAIVTIKDASVTEELIKSTKILEKDKLKYKADLHIEIKVISAGTFSSAQTEIQAWRELTIPADTPIHQKEEHWHSMVEKLFADFDMQMTQNIKDYLTLYVIN